MHTGDASDSVRPGDRWVHLGGAVNVRDLGGLPLRNGSGTTRPARLLRSDNLQHLTASDVHHLRHEIGISDVVDLRTATERRLEGEGPLDLAEDVNVRHLSLLPRTGDEVREVGGDILLPWQGRASDSEEVPVEQRDARSVYTRYLEDRPDSIVAALSTVAHASGAVLVHCAAGKDRTGVVVALALDLVGVERAAILDDYLLTAERIDAILDRLSASRTYADNLRGRDRDTHLPRPEAIKDVFDMVDDHDGTAGWLARHGWRHPDTTALRRRLVR
jgi:protein-tyrosine phosphatase